MKAIKATNGYKTKGAALLYLAISAFGNKIPFINDNREIIVNITEMLIASGILHDIWRNRKKIINSLKSKLSWKKEKVS